jgi:glycosyltransferase involved in cell wall biosynthesis
LFEYGDTKELSDHLVRILSDASHREKLTKGGLDWAKKFSWDHAADMTLELIERIVAASKGRGK